MDDFEDAYHRRIRLAPASILQAAFGGAAVYRELGDGKVKIGAFRGKEVSFPIDGFEAAISLYLSPHVTRGSA